MVERANRTITSTIATCTKDPHQKDWDSKIKEIERNLNNVVNKTTNKTPFKMLHGYSARFHDGLLRAVADESADTWTEPEEIQEEAKKQIEKSHKEMKKTYDKKKCQSLTFERGEIVVMRHVPKLTGIPTKVQPRYKGPLIITETLPNDTYKVTQLEERTKGHFYTTTAHVSQLKPWKCRQDSDDDSSGTSQDEDSCMGSPEQGPHRNPRRRCRVDTPAKQNSHSGQ